MKVLIAPVGAMAETSGPFSRVVALSEKLLEQGHQVALCAALDVNYHTIDNVKNYDCPIPSPFGMPLAIGKRIFGLVRRLGLQQKKKVHSFEQVLFFTGAIQRKLFEKDVFAIRQAIQNFQPDVVYAEFRPSAIVAAKLEKVKVATGYSFPVQKKYASNPEYSKDVQNFIRECQLPPIESILDIFDWADLKVVPSSYELEPITDEHVIFTGPFLHPSQVAYRGERDKIIAYMGNGTVSPKQLVEELSKAFQGTAYQVLIATEQLHPFEQNNIIVHRRFDFNKFMPEAAVYINHGGQNSIMTGLIYGVPQIICPGTVFERKYNASSIEKIGAGKVISAENFQADTIKKILLKFNNDESYADKARKAGAQLINLGGTEKVIKGLELLLHN
jgi:Glycosyltransferase family 28 C-terminal domain.